MSQRITPEAKIAWDAKDIAEVSFVLIICIVWGSQQIVVKRAANDPTISVIKEDTKTPLS